MYPGTMLSVEIRRQEPEKPYLVYAIDPELLECCMSSYPSCQGGYTGQDDSGLHVDERERLLCVG